MGGLDVVLFTGGIGENSSLVRELSCQKLGWMGINIDKEKNEAAAGQEGEITTEDSKVKVFAIPTNEELVIARDTERLVKASQA